MSRLELTALESKRDKIDIIIIVQKKNSSTFKVEGWRENQDKFKPWAMFCST